MGNGDLPAGGAMDVLAAVGTSHSAMWIPMAHRAPLPFVRHDPGDVRAGEGSLVAGCSLERA